MMLLFLAHLTLAKGFIDAHLHLTTTHDGYAALSSVLANPPDEVEHITVIGDAATKKWIFGRFSARCSAKGIRLRAEPAENVDFVMVWPDAVLLNGPVFVTAALQALRENADIGIVGAQLQVLGRDVPSKVVWRLGRDGVVPALTIDGARDGTMDAISPFSVQLMRRSVYESALVATPDYASFLYTMLDLNMRVDGAKVLGEPLDTVAKAASLPEENNDVTLLRNEHKHLEALVRSRFVLPHVRLTYAMECGLGAVLGFTNEALAFVVALESLVDTRVVTGSYGDTACVEALLGADLPAHHAAALQRMSNKMSSWEDDTNTTKVLLLHRDPGRYTSFLYESRQSDCVLGRSMFETSSIPKDWVPSCNSNVHEILVPSAFNQQTFADAGVTTPLSVLHEPYDPHVFFLDDEPADKDTTFRFLSVGKWERRKGFRQLIHAFFDAFVDTVHVHAVELVILSHLDAESKEFDEAIASYESDTDLPAVRLVRRFVPYGELPDFYRQHDVLVSASHGEGWGLPYVEALAVGLPVIAINWSGSTEIFDVAGKAVDRVPYDLTLAVPPADIDNGAVKPQMWATAKRDALANAMLSAVSLGRESAEQRGRQGAKAMKNNFAASIVAEELVAVIGDRVDAGCRKLDFSQPPTPNWFSAHQDDKEEEEVPKGRVRISIID